MTDEKMLPPLTLDDVRVAEPDRDTAEVVNPSETWAQACEKLLAGYPAADVAALLLSMGLIDTSVLWSWWRDECMEVAALGAAREADCPDMALLEALNAADRREWRYPAVHGASAAILQADRRDLAAENARLRALLARVATLLRHATDDGLLDRLAATMHPDEINGICDDVAKAIAK